MNLKFIKCDKCPLLLIYGYYLVKYWLVLMIFAQCGLIGVLKNIVIDLFYFTICYQLRRDAQRITGMGTLCLTTKSQI